MRIVILAIPFRGLISASRRGGVFRTGCDRCVVYSRLTEGLHEIPVFVAPDGVSCLSPHHTSGHTVEALLLPAAPHLGYRSRHYFDDPFS